MNKLVVVADDDFEITRLLSMRLKQLGFSVMCSPDASHALLGAQRLRPDLIILDVNMPGGNGLAVAEMLSSDTESRTIPLIIHTGRSDELTRARCNELGLKYVQKSPHSWDEIKAFVCEKFDIDPDDIQPDAAVGERDGPVNADADKALPQAEIVKVTPNENLGHGAAQEALGLGTENGAATWNAVESKTEQSQPSGQPDSLTASSSENATAPGSLSDNPEGVPVDGPSDDEIRASLPTWAEIRASTCMALESEAAPTQPSDQSASEGEPPAANAVESEPADVDGHAAPPTPSFAPDSVDMVEPASLETAHPLQDSVECEEPEAETNKAKQPTVLCIDDDPDISLGIKMRLATYGVEVLRAFSGMQGFWTALDYSPDVIICDITMPDGEGNYIIGRLKSHPLTEKIPLIILSGQTNPGTKRMITSLGISAYLSKPLIISELLHALSFHIKLPDRPLEASRFDEVLSVGST